MMPSLFSGVSGLKNHQFRMNVIGNNLANVNTVGYKYSRVNFADLVYQTFRDASAPQSVGGTNPVQMGLGATINSVDVVNTQGNLESTGRPTDMAIQGDGFFVLNDGSQNKYTRAGVMVMGLNGTLQNPSDGSSYQGWNAVNGAVDTSVPPTTVNVPVGQVLPARATTNASLIGNLNAAGTLIQGTITNTPSLLAAAVGSTLGADLRNGAGGQLGLQAGDVISITGSVGGTALSGQSLTVTAATTLNDIAAAVQTALRSVADGDLTETAAVQADGSILATSDGSNDITNLQLSVSGNTLFNNAFRYAATIAGGGSSDASDTFRTPARATDTLVSLYDATGASLGLQSGDDITLINANVKGTSILSSSVLADITNATTYAQYRDALKTALFTAAPVAGEDVTIQSDGSLQVTGAPGQSNAVTGIVIGAGPNAGDNTRSVFAAGESFTESQAAADATRYRTSMQVFDSLGNPLSVDFLFTKSALNTWQWDATQAGNAVGSGILSYTTGGALTTPSGSLSIPLLNGAATPLVVSVDFTGSTQFSGASTMVLNVQDGYAAGTLNGFSIGQSGEVIGTFTNGRNQLLGQLAMASFRNPTGLLREGQNLMVESPNSGPANLGTPLTAGRGKIVSGTLEMSNVDIAREFTDMIITERGFQANSRIITTSDRMLEELVNLKR